MSKYTQYALKIILCNFLQFLRYTCPKNPGIKLCKLSQLQKFSHPLNRWCRGSKLKQFRIMKVSLWNCFTTYYSNYTTGGSIKWFILLNVTPFQTYSSEMGYHLRRYFCHESPALPLTYCLVSENFMFNEGYKLIEKYMKNMVSRIFVDNYRDCQIDFKL